MAYSFDPSRPRSLTFCLAFKATHSWSQRLQTCRLCWSRFNAAWFEGSLAMVSGGDRLQERNNFNQKSQHSMARCQKVSKSAAAVHWPWHRPQFSGRTFRVLYGWGLRCQPVRSTQKCWPHPPSSDTKQDPKSKSQQVPQALLASTASASPRNGKALWQSKGALRLVAADSWTCIDCFIMVDPSYTHAIWCYII